MSPSLEPPSCQLCAFDAERFSSDLLLPSLTPASLDPLQRASSVGAFGVHTPQKRTY
jgi:hypothetical protein